MLESKPQSRLLIQPLHPQHYLPGDIGHLQRDGAMVFHSRVAGDTQTKIRGLRIELGDIERNILTESGGVLREAIVTPRLRKTMLPVPSSLLPMSCFHLRSSVMA